MLFAGGIGMQYLMGPLAYVGITQASLCKKLGASATMSNLPASLFFAMTATPALIAWLSPRVSSLKRNLIACYLLYAVMLGITAYVLHADFDPSVKIAVVILQGGMTGVLMPTATAYLWEAIGRGADESKRGLVLSLAFGAGPVLAVFSSWGQSLLLGGSFFFWEYPGLDYPRNFVVLFAAGVPVMFLGAGLAALLIVPRPMRETEREPVSQIVGMLIGLPAMFGAIGWAFLADAAHSASITEFGIGGLGVFHVSHLRLAGYVFGAVAVSGFVYHFRSLLRQRTLLIATLVTVLVYCGNVIPANMNLYSAEALGESPEKFAGYQYSLRFGCKVIAGTFLGWLLTKTNPRAGILATSCIYLVSQIWAMTVTGPWYLVAFGIFGAGELIGVYAPNYIVSASRGEDLRKNTAFMTMLMVPAAPAGYLYGAIVDHVKASGWTALGMDSATLGFRLSFLVCALFIFCGIVLAWVMLPKHPKTPG